MFRIQNNFHKRFCQVEVKKVTCNKLLEPGVVKKEINPSDFKENIETSYPMKIHPCIVEKSFSFMFSKSFHSPTATQTFKLPIVLVRCRQNQCKCSLNRKNERYIGLR
jgi:hypothetical protein